MQRILFLCMGNICRSPAAHCVFQDRVNQAGLAAHYEIESAGTIGMHTGEAPDRRMQQAMRARSIPVIGKARQLKADDLDYYDLILAMDRDNLRGAESLKSGPQQRAKLQLFSEYCAQHTGQDVPDPYYGGTQGFETVLDMTEDGCAQLLEATCPK